MSNNQAKPAFSLKFWHGSSLPEYVLPLVLLALATVATLSANGGLTLFFQKQLTKTVNGNLNQGTLTINTGQAGIFGQAPAAPLPGEGTGGSTTGQPGDKLPLPYPGAPIDLNPSGPLSETAGTNGVDNIFTGGSNQGYPVATLPKPGSLPSDSTETSIADCLLQHTAPNCQGTSSDGMPPLGAPDITPP